MKRKAAVDSNWLPAVAALLLLGAHACLCWRMIGGWAGIRTSFPVLTDDHTFNYYYAVTSRDYLSQHASTAGYDPFFMSGYAKSIIYPTSSTMAEIVVWLFGGDHPERAYKLYVVIGAAICPIALWLGAWVWMNSSGNSLASVLLYLTLFWSDIGQWYVLLGMVPYVLAGALAVLSTGCLIRYFSCQSPAAAWLWWLATATTISLATMIHLTIPIALGPGWIISSLLRIKTSPARVLCLVPVAASVVLANLFWLFPGIFLLSTLEGTASGFINPNVMERFGELLRLDRPIESILVGLGIIGVLIWRNRDRGHWLDMATPLGWFLFLGYLAGWFRFLDFLQPGRYTQYLFTFATLPSGLVIGWTWQRLRARVSDKIAFLTAGFGFTALFVGTLFLARSSLAILTNSGHPVLVTTMPAHLEELMMTLRRVTKPGDRLLFEERNLGISEDGKSVLDPYQSFRIGPLLPLTTKLEVIGGPYLYTHLRTNFTQFGDGKLFTSDDWNASRFEKFARLYDMQWIACWSPESRAFCTQHPELIEPVAHVGSPIAPIFIGRIRRDANPAIVGSAEVAAAPGRIEVRNAHADNGILVLRYHWTPNLTSEPPLEITEHKIDEDPVGLIQIRNPPERFTIMLDPWKPLREWLRFGK